MGKRRYSVLGVAAFVGVAGTVGLAVAGQPLRTATECQKLAGSDTDGERGWCLTCVSRTDPPGKWMYDPNAPAAKRCQPDKGKP
jgi:hypothetical protein